MPFLLSQNRKMFIAVMTTVLLLFSTIMLAFQEHNDVSFETKASVIHATDHDKEVDANH